MTRFRVLRVYQCCVARFRRIMIDKGYTHPF